jgi:hypothetical protein
VQPLDDFFAEIDRRWPDRSVADIATPIPLRLIGSTALMLRTSYRRNTKDSDVLETIDLPSRVRARLQALAGPASDIATRHHLYLDIVSGGVPFLPQRPVWHPAKALDVRLAHFEVWVLDVVDVVVEQVEATPCG